MKARAKVRYLDKERQYIQQDVIRGVNLARMDFRSILDWTDPRKEFAEIEIVDERKGQFKGPVFRRNG